MALLHALDVQAAEVLEHAPVPAPFHRQGNDGMGHRQFDQPAIRIGRPDERDLAVAAGLVEVDELVDRDRLAGDVAFDRSEVLA